MLKRTTWIPIAIVLLGLQLIGDLLVLLGIYRLGVLPEAYLLIGAAVLLILWLLNGILLLTGIGRGPGHRRQRRRILGVIVSLLVTAIVGYGAYAVHKANQAIAEITLEANGSKGQPAIQAVVGVYVRNDDALSKLADAKDYTFGVMADYDPDNTEKAIAQIEKACSGEIKTNELSSATALADALLSNQVDAIVMNEAFVGVLEGTDRYAGFGEKTKVLQELEIEKTESSASENASDETSQDGNAAPNEETTENSSLTTEADSANISPEKDITEHPFAIYISGSDSDGTVLSNGKSDVHVIVVLNPVTRQGLVLNTPGDYMVANPAGNGAMDKLTHCGIYGMDCSMEALENLYQFDIDHYVQINFAGFSALIDTFGGIEVEIPEAMNAGAYSFAAGTQTLNGDQALAYMRESYHLGGDAGRRNQMRVASALMNRIANSGTALLTNYAEILKSLQGMFRTDFTLKEISSLSRLELETSADWNVRMLSMTGQSSSEVTYSMPDTELPVILQDPSQVAEATALIDKIENNELLTNEEP